MLNWIIGPIDGPSAAVLIAFGLGFTVILCTWMQIPTKEDKLRKFELDRAAALNEKDSIALDRRQAHEQAIAKISAGRDVQLAQIEGKTIHVDKKFAREGV